MEKNSESFIERNKKTFEFLQKNYGWIIALFTGICVVVSYISKFLEYIIANVQFAHYGLDIDLYKYENKNFLYNICFSALFIFALCSLIYCIHQLLNRKKYSLNVYDIFINIFIILFSMSSISLSIPNIIINFITMLFLEILASKIIFKDISKKIKTKVSKNEAINNIKKLPFLIIVLVILIMIYKIVLIISNHDYRIIDDNKVIVYSNNEYYLTLDCEVKESEIVIYAGTQNKIPNNNVYSKLIKNKKENVK